MQRILHNAAASLSPSAVLENRPRAPGLSRAPWRKNCPPGASYIVTDLNQPMTRATPHRNNQPDTTRSNGARADALALPFENAAFDLVCCQFGAMFFPDRLGLVTARQTRSS